MNTAVITNQQSWSSNPFDYWWNIDGDWVEPPNHRRNGLSGVKKVFIPGEGTFFIKIQRNHLHRSLRYPFGRPTVMREAETIKACHHLGVIAPETIYCGKRKTSNGWQAVLVTRELENFISLDQWLNSGSCENDPLEIRKYLIQQIARTLSIFHRAHWQHGCLYPKHIFLHIAPNRSSAEVQIALIDLEKSRRRLIAKNASGRDLNQLKRHLPQFSDEDWLLLTKHYQHYFK